MAITVSTKDQQMTLGGGSTYVTASVSITAGHLAIAMVASTHATSAPLPTCSGAGQTWTQAVTRLDASNSLRLTTFYGSRVAGSGAVTFTFSSVQDVGAWAVITFAEGSGAPLSVIQSSSGTTALGTSVSANLADAPLSSQNLTFGSCYHNVDEATTAGSGYTEQWDVHDAAGISWQGQYNDNDQNCGWSWASAAFGVANSIEVGLATGAAVGMIPIGI